MDHDNPQVRNFLQRSMNMRVATLSAHKVPHITPLRFIYDGRSIYALTRTVTLVARHIRERPNVVLLFDAEQRTGPVLRVRAHAVMRSDSRLTGWMERRAATKYFLRRVASGTC
jgi:nitroimidazol reductase NimA-like FMN-containing flavoprotein (pyridoxamine 5'-phosphate oxidase superfamily)